MSSQVATDRAHLARAVELACRGEGTVSPNPLVGAVIARGAEIVGEGWHERLGGAHAEVNAIAACGEAELAGATLYVSLEPCCHTGRTPPCTEAILAAGIRRVVVASDDPTDKASGRGLGILRDEGVEVILGDGELAARARLLNQPFRKHARVRRPWVLFKSAMTIDGKVATRAGDSQWISGAESRARAHAWRASLDAVIVGIGTALSDDPQLTARPVDAPLPRERQPRRVVFDSLARLPLDSRLIAQVDEAPVTVIVSRAARRAA
ncbi:MAG: bifunctional diaminohydroxyphosphoribosylaminopyrimidine deaminase/5-amino-6-(5-phosphoribosylamino)uracil reductase RibD, partial [Solirubrobacteraceae bacterium]